MNKKQRVCECQSIKMLSKTFGLRDAIKEMYSQGEIPSSCAVQYVGGVLN